TQRPSKKLDDKRAGPFKILEKVGAAAYRLELPAQWKIHPVFNEVLLSRYQEPIFPSQQTPPPPPPDIIEQQEEYEVEEIRDSRMHRRRLEYLMHWKGYPSEEDTWEPEKNVAHSPEAIADFHRRYPSAPRRINAVLNFRPYENLTIIHEDVNL